MNAEQIISAVSALAKSQGFYGRILESIMENDRLLDLLVAQRFSDVVDLVMFLEN